MSFVHSASAQSADIAGRAHSALQTHDARSWPVESAMEESSRRLFGQVAPAVPESDKRMNLAGIDLVSLRLVVLCAETRSLSAAARHLNMSLSCASHRLSHLEELFGTCFFVRDYQGMRATPAGSLFARHVGLSLDIIRSCRDRIALASRVIRNRESPNSEIDNGC